jgi:hypothetical protein
VRNGLFQHCPVASHHEGNLSPNPNVYRAERIAHSIHRQEETRGDTICCHVPRVSFLSTKGTVNKVSGSEEGGEAVYFAAKRVSMSAKTLANEGFSAGIAVSEGP